MKENFSKKLQLKLWLFEEYFCDYTVGFYVKYIKYIKILTSVITIKKH